MLARRHLPLRALLSLSALVLFALFCRGADERWQATVSTAGEVTLTRSGRRLAGLLPGLFEQDWRDANLGAARTDGAKPGVRCGEIVAPSGGHVSSELRVTPVNGGAQFAWTLTPQADLALHSLHVSIEFPAEVLAGGTWVADAEHGAFPGELKDPSLLSKPLRSLSLTTRSGDEVLLVFAQPTNVLLQDDRKWGPSFSVRIGPPLDPSKPWPKGRALDLAFALTSRQGLELVEDAPVKIQAGPDWIPMDTELDVEAGSALDLRGAGRTDSPAGKHGWIVARPDGEFAFEDDLKTARRFCGVNLCYGANYLEQREADRLAERLARLGYNAVRIHHYEEQLVDRSKEPGVWLDEESLGQLDTLFAALKKQGLYVTTDLFVSRPVPARAIWDGASGDVEMDDFKMLVPVNERAFENWKGFAKDLLTHVNPHTGLSYGRDPALAWLSMINEGNFGNYIGRLDERTRREWQKAWEVWLKKKDPAAGAVPLPKGLDDPARGVDLAVFFAETEREMFRRMRTFIRDEVGTRALLTDMNSWTNPPATQLARLDYDYVDDHFYVYHPQFLEKPWNLPSRCDDANPVEEGAPGGRSCAFLRVPGKPFTVTECNYVAPGRYRGLGGLLLGSLAALQGWNGVWRYAYSQMHDNLFAPTPIAYFDLASDPLNQAADRAAICLFLRGDMKPAPHLVALSMNEADLAKGPKRTESLVPPWTALALVTRVGCRIDRANAKGLPADVVLPVQGDVDPYAEGTGAVVLDRLHLQDNRTDLARNRVESETGEFLVDASEMVLVVKTPSTAGGYAREGKSIEAGPVSIKMEKGDGAVWVSSVDGKPIAESKRLLVTHLTDLQDTGARFGEAARETLLSWGKLPHLVRAGRATLTLKTPHANGAKAWAIATSGRRVEALPTKVGGGTLTLALDVSGQGGKARMLYEIEAQ